MANYELVFDLGSQYISAGLKSDGFIDKIPSVVAYGESKQISAVGLDAVNLSRTNPSVKLAHPILEGGGDRFRRRKGAGFRPDKKAYFSKNKRVQQVSGDLHGALRNDIRRQKEHRKHISRLGAQGR